MKDFVDHAKKNLTPVRDRLVFYKDEQEFLPGVTALSAPGHTVGHTIFVISSDEQDQLCLHRRASPTIPIYLLSGKAADGVFLRYRSEAGGE